MEVDIPPDLQQQQREEMVDMPDVFVPLYLRVPEQSSVWRCFRIQTKQECTRASPNTLRGHDNWNFISTVRPPCRKDVQNRNVCLFRIRNHVQLEEPSSHLNHRAHPGRYHPVPGPLSRVCWLDH